LTPFSAAFRSASLARLVPLVSVAFLIKYSK
jgi:hypothetical protein